MTRTQLKQINQLSLPQQYDCSTRKDIKTHKTSIKYKLPHQIEATIKWFKSKRSTGLEPTAIDAHWDLTYYCDIFILDSAVVNSQKN